MSQVGAHKRIFEIASEMLAFTDPELAQRHGLSALCELTRAQVAVHAVLSNFHPQGRGEVLSVVDVGWSSEKQQAVAVRPYLTLGCRADPSATRLMDRVTRHESRWLARRSDLIGDGTWYGSEFFEEARSPADIDHLIHSVTRRRASTTRRKEGEVVNGLTVIRAKGDRNFSVAELELVGLFHAGAWPLWERHRLRSTDELLEGFELSPRERQTTERLLEGQTPAEVADALGISRNTCQQYIKSVYRKLHVTSRAQLMARLGPSRRFP